MVKSLFAASSLLAVPVLLSLAYRGWAATIRVRLPQWRNALGEGAMLFLLSTWLLYSGVFILSRIRLELTSFYGPEWAFALRSFNVISVLLAMALKGVPRLQIVAGALLTFWCISAVEYY
jgi:hypothetical protein